MKARSLLLLFFVIQGGSSSGEEKLICSEQRGSIIVEELGSVTIPCNFTYGGLNDTRLKVRVSWKRGAEDRCGNREFIYDHEKNKTHPDYTGRISLGENPNKVGTATITVKDLRITDRPMICCRVEIYEGSRSIEKWQNRHGTQIQFKDTFSVVQMDVVPAYIGEDIIIPCLVRNKKSSSLDVTWKVGSSDLCVENDGIIGIWNEGNKSHITERWSVVNFPEDLSLRIQNVISEDFKQYCCKVKTNPQNKNLISPIHGTEVVLLESTASKDPTLKVVQPAGTSSGEDGSATLSCSFTYKSDTDPLWREVFWRVNSPSGFYAYHPLTEMVDSSYRGRTQLNGLADLHIKGVNDKDYTTYYCFVMLKFCIGNNKTKSTIQHGSGTKLYIKGTHVPNTSDHATYNNTWVYVLAAALSVLLILCVVVILKKKGVICQKGSRREDVKHLTSDIALRDQNPSGNVQIPSATFSDPPVAQEDSGGLIYAHLNVSSLQQKTSNGNKGRKPDNDSEVLYAAVKPSGAPQDIYTTVCK